MKRGLRMAFSHAELEGKGRRNLLQPEAPCASVVTSHSTLVDGGSTGPVSETE